MTGNFEKELREIAEDVTLSVRTLLMERFVDLEQARPARQTLEAMAHIVALEALSALMRRRVSMLPDSANFNKAIDLAVTDVQDKVEASEPKGRS